MMLREIVPVILCGGAGRRLRPLSTPGFPKPFLKLGRNFSMLQETLLRVQGCADPVLVLNRLLESRLRADLQSLSIKPQNIIYEPVGRNTAPALAAAAFTLKESLMLVLPSDHAIGNPEILMRGIERAAPLAKDGGIISFGIKPRRVETGFGYIRRGPVIGDGIFRIDRFIEKPPRDLAKTLMRSGICDWNSGIFLISAKTALAELGVFEPELLRAVAKAVQNAKTDGPSMHLDNVFAEAPSLSIDVALMERSDKTLVVPIDLDWSDLGTWPALLRHVFQ